MEEATEFNEDDYKQLTLRLSRDKSAEDVQIYLSFNPIDENHWCVKLTEYGKLHSDDFLVHHSTYKDNIKNLSKTFVKELESLIDTDENFYRIYALGLPGVLKNKIYTHFLIEDSSTWNWAQLNIAPHCYGLDFGYNNPMALVEIWYFEDEFYVMERFYKSEKTTDDLAFWMEVHGISHSDTVYADSAEPDRIETLCTSRKVTSSIEGEESTIWINGFNTKPAKKDVKAGIDFVKGKKVHICSKSVNLIKESNNYKYKEDKAGNVFDEPVQVFNHALDGTRYGIFTMAVEYGLTGYHHTEEYTEDVGYGVEGGERGVYSGY
ncbi:MAG: phage terminase large subunit, partial [Candidatus Omnitrophica bacterium]|nr:phage terminase large subunit [Candidatus Omnitrophota bacterium]